MKTSESTSIIDKAVFNVQCAIGKALKGKKNDFFKSKYADLLSVWKACHESLKNNELFVVQPIVTRDGKNIIETWIKHTSGEYYVGEMIVEVAPDHKIVKGSDKEIRSTVTPQAVGSAITYYRRYSLVSMLCIMQDDDDGNAGSNKKENKGKPPPAPPAPINAGQKERIAEEMERINPKMTGEAKKNLLRQVLGDVSIKSRDSLDQKQADYAITILSRMKPEVSTPQEFATPAQVTKIYTMFGSVGKVRAKDIATEVLGRDEPIKTMTKITREEVAVLFDYLEENFPEKEPSTTTEKRVLIGQMAAKIPPASTERTFVEEGAGINPGSLRNIASIQEDKLDEVIRLLKERP